MTFKQSFHPVLRFLFFTTLIIQFLATIVVPSAYSSELPAALPLQVEPFEQQVHTSYTKLNGLPSIDVLQLASDDDGIIYAQTKVGLARFENSSWQPLKSESEASITEQLFAPAEVWHDSLTRYVPSREQVRAVAQHQGEIAVAAENGLYLGDGKKWRLALPQQGHVRWAPVDVRAVAYDLQGRLWFAAPQGVGVRYEDGSWQLFTGADGLPYNDFTCMAVGPKGIWFGTTNGAIRYYQGQWEFRQGGRWLVNNHVLDIHVDAEGSAWFATPGGISRINFQSTTLAVKAAFYEDEIEKYHRRTSFGYVNPAVLSAPGDKSTAVPVFTDNDGFNTGMYLAAMSHAYAATNKLKYRQYAQKSFKALAFLSEVTQGGPHAAPSGFIARNVVPITDPDPNLKYNLAYDVRRNKADSLWKIIQPRLPVDASGKWYWKCDSSSDELDGHFFGFATYFDLVCKSDEQKAEVQTVVRRIIDHILEHDYSLVDYDGRPTRWAHFSPDDMNRNAAWCDERGLNSYSILTYLAVAHHVTGDPRYRKAYHKLAFDHGYGMNGMTQPKALPGPNSHGHQPDDNMAFMNYYHLIRYETNPQLLSMYQHAIRSHWQYEKLERDSFTNFIYAACAKGKTRRDQWGEIDLSPPRQCYTDAVDTLRRYPLDLIEWPISNAHRTDLAPLGYPSEAAPTVGGRTDGYAFPIDERHETYWDWDPWRLTSDTKGTHLRPGFHYLLAYYMGLSHGYIVEEQ